MLLSRGASSSIPNIGVGAPKVIEDPISCFQQGTDLACQPGPIALGSHGYHRSRLPQLKGEGKDSY